jgi:IMP cyclohydrolase
MPVVYRTSLALQSFFRQRLDFLAKLSSRAAEISSASCTFARLRQGTGKLELERDFLLMYVGRIVAVGLNQAGAPCGLYRVSSRSFPDREARVISTGVAIVPKPGHEQDIFQNPYIAYNCLQLIGERCVVSNGSHTDIIVGKLADGLPPRDALIGSLHAMDYEHDSLETPRIAGIVESGSNRGFLGIVTKGSLHVKAIELTPGRAWYVATYEHDEPGDVYSDSAFDVADGEAACNYILGEGVFADLERPITAACAVATGNGYDVAVANKG